MNAMDAPFITISVFFMWALAAAPVAIIVWLLVTRPLRLQRHEAAVQAMLQTFGPARAAAQHDAKQLLAWHPLAEASRKLFPAAFDALDGATGSRFPFPKDAIERTHARVSSDWLAWEKAHDEEYRIKAAAAEQELAVAAGEAAALARARLDRIQHEKIERYQQRYEEYVRTAKALQALLQ
jgi:hypothetical protein